MILVEDDISSELCGWLIFLFACVSLNPKMITPPPLESGDTSK